MQKIGYILVCSGILTGCSVFRPTLYQNVAVAGKESNIYIMQELENKNITSNNFFIQKAKIEILSEGTAENFLASIKYLKPDTFLISLRSKTGIEAARIFLTKDTILINDRINRILRYGNSATIERNYGITSEILPVILGDYVKSVEIRDIKTDCVDGTAVVKSNFNGARLIFNIDCKEGKAVSVLREGSIEKFATAINFKKFIKIHNVVYPSRIKLKYSGLEVNIEIEKVESPWIGDIDFIPGKNYEVVELL